MAAIVETVGELKLEFTDVNNAKFTEIPFYVKINLLTEDESQATNNMSALNACVDRMTGDKNLVNATLNNASLTYKVNIFDPS